MRRPLTIGFSYDLRDEYLAQGYAPEDVAEFDTQETVDQIAAALAANGYRVERIGHVRALAKRLAAGERWDLVFNICEGLSGVAREAQVPALLEAFGVPYVFSDPLTMALTLDKAKTKRVLRDASIPTAPFAVVERIDQAETLDLAFPLFAKPLAEGTSKGITARSYIATREQLASACDQLLRQFRQPVLVEAYLPGREFTVGMLGEGESAEAIGVLEMTLNPTAEPHGCTLLNKEECESRITYCLATDIVAQEAAGIARAAWRLLGCRDAGRVDLRCDARGRPQFLEVNPLAGLHPTHSDLPILAKLAGIDYNILIGKIVEAACARVGIASRERGALARTG